MIALAKTVKINASPRGPRGPGLLLHQLFLRHPGLVMQTCRRLYGETFAVQGQAGKRYVFSSSPRGIRQILQADESVLQPGQVTRSMLPRFMTATTPMLSLPQTDHRLRRKELLGALAQCDAESLARFAGAAGKQMTAKWPADRTFTVDRGVDELAFKIAARLVLGERSEAGLSPHTSEFIAAIGDYSRRVMRWRQLWRETMPGSGWQAACDANHALVAAIGNAAKAGGDPGPGDGLVHRLSQRHGGGVNAAVTDSQFVFYAMYISLSSILKNAVYRLSTSLGKQDELRRRLQASPEDADEYLDAVVSECLRLEPSFPMVPRTVLQPTTIDDCKVEPGDVVGACIYLAHRRPEVFQNPESFEPERFIDRHYGPFDYLPYSRGPHSCVGPMLVKPVLRSALAAIFSSRRLRSAHRLPNRTVMHFIHLVRARPVRVRATAK